MALAPASPLPRACAWLIDLLIRALVYLALSMLLATAGAAGWGLLLLLVFVLEWFYPVFFELLWQGQTPGKRVLGLRVVSEEAVPVSPSASVLRNLLRAADILPAFYLAGFVTMLVSRRRQRLGDLAAATLVIHDSKTAAPQTEPGETALAPDWATDAADRQVLLDFLERWPRLSPARRAELAHLACPELSAARAERQLRANAVQVLGKP